MTYRVYIKKDYKPEVAWVQDRSPRSHRLKAILFSSLVIISCAALFLLQQRTVFDPIETDTVSNTIRPVIELPSLIAETELAEITDTELNKEPAMPPFVHEADADVIADTISSDIDVAAASESEPLLTEEERNTKQTIDWQSVTVKSGDSMALIFSRLGLSPSELYNIMTLGKDVARLKKIRPGQIIHFHIVDKKLHGLEYEFDLSNTLSITLHEETFVATVVEHELNTIVKNATADIKDSLFLSAKRAGLSDNLIMQMVAIYGWDIDFALDIRQGDSFTLIYEEKYKDGVKVIDGPIVAAEFTNRNKVIRAIRYAHTDGKIDYYDDNGDAMRKAFLRTPVNFTRISSRFNLKRKHPILNKIRAHRGVDYAAPTGTPIKATGDGTIGFAGRKGGYGKTVILKHGGKYSTVYAHLHKYANGVRKGKRVKQGQIIGYVGKSGLATGPHLHYEFRIHGVHRNPLTVELPHVESIGKEEMPAFQEAITPMLAELDRITGKRVLAAQQPQLSDNTAGTIMEDG